MSIPCFSWDAPVREHEAPGGVYANGIISKTYRQGSLIPIIVDITANHQVSIRASNG